MPDDLTRHDLINALETARRRLTTTMTRPQVELFDAFDSAMTKHWVAELDLVAEGIAQHFPSEPAEVIRLIYGHLLEEPCRCANRAHPAPGPWLAIDIDS